LYEVSGRLLSGSKKLFAVLAWEGLPLLEKDLVAVLSMICGFFGLKLVESWSVSRSAAVTFCGVISSVRLSAYSSWSMVYLAGAALLRLRIKFTRVSMSLKLTGRISPVSTSTVRLGPRIIFNRMDKLINQKG
jgi:hypothetical protein